MAKTINGFDVLTRYFGPPLIEIATQVLEESDFSFSALKDMDINFERLKEGFKDYTKSVQTGHSFEILSFFIDNPDFVKLDGHPIDMNEVFKKKGFFLHLWKLFF